MSSTMYDLTASEKAAILRGLRACEIAPAAICDEALEAARFLPLTPQITSIRGPRTLVAFFALRQRARGITLADHVYLRPDELSDQPEIELLAHEIAHVVQYRRDGFLAFLLRYVGEYLAGRARGLDDRSAYLAISYEVQARAVAAATIDDLEA